MQGDMGMLKRIAIGACLVCVMAGTAYAVDDQAGLDACTEELARAEGLFHDQIEGESSMSEADVEKASLLLDEADALCTAGSFAEASKTLAAVTKLVSTPSQ
jgi:hypothetical protein